MVNWASSNGFKGLEVSVSPTLKQLDLDRVLNGGAGEVRRLFASKDLEITSLALYGLGNLQSTEEQEFLEKMMEAASVLDVNRLIDRI